MTAMVLAASLSAPPARATGAVLTPAGSAPAQRLSIEVAVAHSPLGTTRWSRVTVQPAPSTKAVMWLVPVRPGARLDWAPDAWLDALDETTAARVSAPLAAPPCTFDVTPERVPRLGDKASKTPATSPTLHRTEADARAHVAAAGFGVTPELATRIARLYADGEQLVSMEFAVGRGEALTSPTLRVSDDDDARAASLPFTLTAGANESAWITAYVFADAPTTLGQDSFDIAASALSWGSEGSNYRAIRRDALEQSGGSLWVRESSTHEAVFAGSSLGEGRVPSLADTYFAALSQGTCAKDAAAVASTNEAYGRPCAPGRLLRVAESDGSESRCESVETTLPSAAFTCSVYALDLALALTGLTPARVHVSRFSGVIAAHAYGGAPAAMPTTVDLPLQTYASRYEACGDTPKTPSPSASPPPRSSAPPAANDGSDGYVSAGCSGDTTTVYEDDSTYVDDSDDSCSSGTSGGDGWDDSGDDDSGDDDDDDSGWDSSDDSDDGDDSGWDSSDDNDMSSSDDGCSGSSSSSSSGTVDELGASPRAKRPHLGRAKGKHEGALAPRRGKNPVSRVALLFVAVLLPLRRRGKKAPEDVVFPRRG